MGFANCYRRGFVDCNRTDSVDTVVVDMAVAGKAVDTAAELAAVDKGLHSHFRYRFHIRPPASSLPEKKFLFS